MLYVTLEIDNNYACSLSPLEFLKKKILKDCSELEETLVVNEAAFIRIKEIRQE